LFTVRAHAIVLDRLKPVLRALTRVIFRQESQDRLQRHSMRVSAC